MIPTADEETDDLPTIGPSSPHLSKHLPSIVVHEGACEWGIFSSIGYAHG